MPFDFLKRRKPATGRAGGCRRRRRPARPGIPFDGMTEDWRLVGRMMIDGRLSDALNKREPIAIETSPGRRPTAPRRWRRRPVSSRSTRTTSCWS